MTHIPGRLETISLRDYPAFLESLKKQGKGITGADKRVFDPNLNKFIPAIVYVGIAEELPVKPAGKDGQLRPESISAQAPLVSSSAGSVVEGAG